MPTPYADALRHFNDRNPIRLNIPGHSADQSATPELAEYFGERILERDVTPLLPGLDVGKDSPLAAAQRLAAEAWGARRVWFLTNGASQANRIGALALGGFRSAADPVLVQRSAHSSFIDGMILGGIHPVFLQPRIDEEYGIAHGVSVAELRRKLQENPNTKGVYVVSPSYFGAVADIAGFVEVCHSAGVPLLVDAAWGAHFGFHPELPKHPISLGADLVVSSTHKFGGSLTQSAMIQLADGPFADELEALVQRAFMVSQSTSMSSLLLASLDLAREALVNGEERIARSIAAAEDLRRQIRAGDRFGIVSDGWKFPEIVAADPLRVSIDVRKAGLNGNAVLDLLVSQAMYPEISTHSCIVAFVPPGREPDWPRFLEALGSIEPAGPLAYSAADAIGLPQPGRLKLTPRQAWFSPTEVVDSADAVGRVSSESLSAYPPGIPNALPGEEFTRETIEFLRHVAAIPGGFVRGAFDPSVSKVRVVAD
ncbi:MAG: PLP-dependent transferase [Cryobacterium sp.]|nr:PLP-dependent transferase [Cryobacterium sp.]